MAADGSLPKPLEPGLVRVGGAPEGFDAKRAHGSNDRLSEDFCT